MFEGVSAILNFDLWSAIKWVYVFAFGLYVIFTLVVMRQIDLMVATVGGAWHAPIRLLGVFLVAVAGLALIAAIVLL